MFIDEVELFRLSINSKQEKAIKFQEWIIDIVLPELKCSCIYQLKKNIMYIRKNEKNKKEKYFFY